MAKTRRRKAPDPAEPIHGPARPPSVPFGLAHLRKALSLSAEISVDRLAEDAAIEIESLRAQLPDPSAFAHDRDTD